MTTLEKKVSWAQEVLSRKDAKLQEVTFPFLHRSLSVLFGRDLCVVVLSGEQATGAGRVREESSRGGIREEGARAV